MVMPGTATITIAAVLSIRDSVDGKVTIIERFLYTRKQNKKLTEQLVL